MPMPIKSSEWDISRAWDLVRDIRSSILTEAGALGQIQKLFTAEGTEKSREGRRENPSTPRIFFCSVGIELAITPRPRPPGRSGSPSLPCRNARRNAGRGFRSDSPARRRWCSGGRGQGLALPEISLANTASHPQPAETERMEMVEAATRELRQ